MAGKRPYDPMAQREATTSMMLDGLDVLLLIIGIYVALGSMFALGITRREVIGGATLGVALLGPITRRVIVGPPPLYRNNHSRLIAVLGFLLIAIGAVFAGFGGLFLYLAMSRGDDKTTSLLVAGGGLVVLIVGDLLDRSQRR
ncbi:MAG TPA: hypothetical protein VIU61_08545 [Kofleriaceae bacterium]